MSIKPADRHSTARAFADELGEWLGEEVAGPRISPVRIAATVTLTVLVCTSLFLFWQRRSNSASIRGCMDRAKLMMKEENFGAAAGAYEQALAFEPDNEEAKTGRETAKQALDLQRRLYREAQAAIRAPTLVRLDSFRKVQGDSRNEVTPSAIELRTRSIFDSPVEIPETGDYELIVSASSEGAQAASPEVRFLVDGTPGPRVTVHGDAPFDYRVKMVLALGTRRLGIEFLGDVRAESPGVEPTLRIHGVALRRLK
jgi:hypothetical protein